MEFKEIQLQDKEIFDKYIKEYPFNTYEYSFATLYMWRKMCKVHFGLVQNSLVVRKEEEGKGQYFIAPIGVKEEAIEAIVSELSEYKKTHSNMPYLFRDIEEDFLHKLIAIYGDKVKYVEDENNFDYIYETKELINLSGKKYHSKKNHYNSFMRSYSYSIRDLKEGDTAEHCVQFAEFWMGDKNHITEELQYEFCGIKDIIKHSKELNIEGMAVYVEEKIVGFTLGERLNENMALIHIEKGDNDYNGIYAFINKMFLEKYFSDSKILNREEDLGIKGLRKAKASYHPIKLEKKYIVNIEV